MENVIEYEGKKYRQVKRKADVGELVMITRSKDFAKDVITKVIEVDGMFDDGSIIVEERGSKFADGYVDGRKDVYVVLEPIEESAPEPSPQLAGIYDALAKLATAVVDIGKQLNEYEALGLSDLLRKGLPQSQTLTPLQLAILNAKDTPNDVKLSMIVEAGRLETERQAIVNDR
jgi:hypothetical protein